MHPAEGQSSSHLEEGTGDSSGGAGKILLLDCSAGYMGVLSLWKFIKLYTLNNLYNFHVCFTWIESLPLK